MWVAGAATKLVEVTTAAGHLLTCTPEHRFLTADGYVEAEHLQPGTELIAFAAEDADHGSPVATLQRIAVRDAVATVEAVELAEPTLVYDLEASEDHNFAVASHTGAPIVVHNSEYMSIDDSACNLASLNLMKFRKEDGEFDVDAFEHAVDVTFLAQEILVGYSSYPTPEIEANAKAYRQLGLGYANLGALLMARGLPYDSDEGRAYAAAITSLMTGRAYRKSAEIAARMGPFAGYRPNAAPMIGVMAKHRAAVGNIEDAHVVPADMLTACRKAWDDVLNLGEVHGYRNAQATVLAPTGCLVGDSLVSTSRGLVRLRSLGDPVGQKWQDLGRRGRDRRGRPRGDEVLRQRLRAGGLGRDRPRLPHPGHRDAPHPRRRRRGQLGVEALRRDRRGRPRAADAERHGRRPQQVDLPPLGELYWTSDHVTRVPRTMTPELAELVGYFMGDGSLHAKGLRFCVAQEDQDVVEHLRDSIAALFGLDADVTAKKGYTEVAVNSVPLTLWWEACGFAKLPPGAEHRGKGWVPQHPRRRPAHERPRRLRGVRPRPLRGGRDDEQRLRLVEHDERDLQPRRADADARARLRDDAQGRPPEHELGRQRPLRPAAAERRLVRAVPRGRRLHLHAQGRLALERRPPAGARATTTSRSAGRCSTSWRPRTTRSAGRC